MISEQKKLNKPSLILNTNTYTNLVISSPTHSTTKDKSKQIKEENKLNSVKGYLKDIHQTTVDFKQSIENRMSKLESTIYSKLEKTVEKDVQTDVDLAMESLRNENMELKQKLECAQKEGLKYKNLYEELKIEKMRKRRSMKEGASMAKLYDKKIKGNSEFEEVLNLYKGTKLRAALDCFVKSFS